MIVVLGAEKHSMIRVKWMTKIFVAGDVLSFLMQSAGKTHSDNMYFNHSTYARLQELD